MPVMLDHFQVITNVGWPSGFVAVVGEESVVNFFTARKLGLSGGGLTWGKTVAEELYDVAFDSAGRVWMGGAPVFADSDQLWQFDASGNQLRALQPFPDVESADVPTQQGVRALAIDGDGNIIVGGRYPFGTIPDSLAPNLKKYSADGTLVWSSLINPNAAPVTFDQQHVPEQIAVAADDNLFIRMRSPPSAEDTLFKVSADGSKLWQITSGAYPGSLAREDLGSGSGVAVDHSGSGVYVSARLALTSGAYHIKHIDAAGNVSTGPEFDSFGGGAAFATTDDGFVFASGLMSNEPDDPVVLRKYTPGSDPHGLTLVWSRTLNIGPDFTRRLVRLAATAAGGVVGVSASGNIYRYDADGNRLWQTSHGADLNSVAVSIAAASGSA